MGVKGSVLGVCWRVPLLRGCELWKGWVMYRALITEDVLEGLEVILGWIVGIKWRGLCFRWCLSDGIINSVGWVSWGTENGMLGGFGSVGGVWLEKN